MSDERAALFRIADVLREAMAGRLQPVEAAEQLNGLFCSLPQPGEDLALRFAALRSEADTLLVGNRALWSEEFLRDMDRRREAYESQTRPQFLKDCSDVQAAIDAWIHECPVCGFVVPGKPPYDANGEPSYETCPACGFHFGITDDADGTSFRTWRRSWVAAGMPFRHPPAPPRWNPEAQLQAAKLTDRQRR